MSKHTLSRIPQNVQHIFKVYETASYLYRPYEDRFVSQFVDKTGSYYEQFNRNKLRGHADVNGVYTPIFNKSDFPPVVRDIVARIFDTPLQLEGKLDLPDVPFDDLDDEPLFSDRHTTAKHFSDYQAKILSSLASYYSPLTSAESPSAQKSLKWYRKLLQNAPVIFFLSQKQRLMTESSMRGINQPLKEFRRDLDKIKRRYVTDPDINKRIRNYHLTDLVTTDLFRLSVEREGMEGQGLSEASEASKASKGPERPERPEGSSHTTSPKSTPDSTPVNFTDTLCTYLHNLRAPRITGKKGNTCSTQALSRLETKYRLRRITRAVKDLDDPHKVPDVFPYDIHYNDLFMLTIERPIFEENHKDVLDLLQQQKHFHVFAARISRAEASSVDLGSELELNSKPSNAQTYDQLLEWAQNHRPDVAVNHVSHLLEQIGEWGLVEVEENASKSAFYVFGEPQQNIKGKPKD